MLRLMMGTEGRLCQLASRQARKQQTAWGVERVLHRACGGHALHSPAADAGWPPVPAAPCAARSDAGTHQTKTYLGCSHHLHCGQALASRLHCQRLRQQRLQDLWRGVQHRASLHLCHPLAHIPQPLMWVLGGGSSRRGLAGGRGARGGRLARRRHWL